MALPRSQIRTGGRLWSASGETWRMLRGRSVEVSAGQFQGVSPGTSTALVEIGPLSREVTLLVASRAVPLLGLRLQGNPRATFSDSASVEVYIPEGSVAIRAGTFDLELQGARLSSVSTTERAVCVSADRGTGGTTIRLVLALRGNAQGTTACVISVRAQGSRNVGGQISLRPVQVFSENGRQLTELGPATSIVVPRH